MSKYPVIILLTVSMSAMSLTACNNYAAVKATSTDTSVYVYEAGSEDQADTTIKIQDIFTREAIKKTSNLHTATGTMTKI